MFCNFILCFVREFFLLITFLDSLLSVVSFVVILLIW